MLDTMSFPKSLYFIPNLHCIHTITSCTHILFLLVLVRSRVSKFEVSSAPYPAKMMVSGVRIKKPHVCVCMRATSSRMYRTQTHSKHGYRSILPFNHSCQSHHCHPSSFYIPSSHLDPHNGLTQRQPQAMMPSLQDGPPIALPPSHAGRDGGT